jgi:serine/threonine-protein kinase
MRILASSRRLAARRIALAFALSVAAAPCALAQADALAPAAALTLELSEEAAAPQTLSLPEPVPASDDPFQLAATDPSPEAADASDAGGGDDELAKLVELQRWQRSQRKLSAPSPLEDDGLRSERIAAATPESATPHPWIPQNLDREWSLRSGLLLAELGDAERAASALQRALGLGHASREAWQTLGRMRIALGDLDAAHGALLAALDHTDSSAAAVDIHRDLGELALLDRRYGHAIAALERAAELAPSDRGIERLLARARHVASPSGHERPQVWPSLRTAAFPAEIHARATQWARTLATQLPAAKVKRLERAAAALARPETERGAWTALAVLCALLVTLRVLRGHGDLVVAIEYPAELRGTFTVRLARRVPPRRSRKARRQASADVLKGGASSRSVHTMVSRETQFRRLRPGRYWISIEGLLQAQSNEEVLADLIDDRPVVVKRRRATRAEFDLQPSEGAVDVTVLWDKRPVKEAGVVALGTPGSLRYARGGPVRLQLARGPHCVAVGSGDRVAVCKIEVDSYQPEPMTIDLAGSDAVLFKGCPPAVDLYLHGDVSGAAAALEREGQVQKGNLLLARLHQDEGRSEKAAEHFELAERWVEAAELWAELGDLARAAPLFDRAGDSARAAEMHRRSGSLVEAGAAFERARDFEAAVGCYREAGAITQWIDALERCGMIFEASQVALQKTERRRAIRLLQQVLPEDSRYAEASMQLASVLEEEGHVDLAAEKLAEYVRVSGEAAKADAQFHLAELLEQGGETDRSLSVLEALRQREPTYPHLATRIESLRKRRSAELDAETQRQSGRNLRATAPLMGDSRYDVHEEIGRGGMGVVYRAHDKRLNREVALKRMPEKLREHPKAIEFFLREAQAVARLNHRNIVTLYDVDQEDDVFFLTMELLQGHPLNRVLKGKGRIGPRDVARLGLQVADGLEYAHEQGVVHRDIKTANLFLTKDKIVTIMDFGLAKMTEEVRKGSTIIGGTPFYMAPEQAAGQPVDHRSDLYALGVTLFELVTGKVPFEEGDVAYHHRHTPAPDPRSLAKGIPDALAELILDLLAKEPDDRPASAAEVKQRLEAIVRA